MLTFEVKSHSIYYFDKYSNLDHMLVKFEQNCMVWTTRNFKFFNQKQKTKKQTNKQKRGCKNHFSQSVDAILEDVSVTETIAWC